MDLWRIILDEDGLLVSLLFWCSMSLCLELGEFWELLVIVFLLVFLLLLMLMLGL